MHTYRVNGSNAWTHEQVVWTMLAKTANLAARYFQQVFKDVDGWELTGVSEVSK